MNKSLELSQPIIDVCHAINSIGKAVIVGGFVRNFFLEKPTHDVDIEVYEVLNISDLEVLLKPFGSLHCAGKKFGVLMLSYQNYTFDITLAREENSIGVGHKDFYVASAPYAPFETIALRRDFTINAIGYDTKNSQLLDPFHGLDDLMNKTLKMVNPKRFDEDPLRVLRAVGFISRFDLTPDHALLETSKNIVRSKSIETLSSERIFSEISKWFTKSPSLSKGFIFLNAIGLSLFHHLDQETDLQEITTIRLNRSPWDLSIRLTLLYCDFSLDLLLKDLNLLTHNKKLIEKTSKLFLALQSYLALYKDFNKEQFQKLASNYLVKDILPAATAYDAAFALWIKEQAKELGVLNSTIAKLIKGDDLIKAGYKPSKKFSDLIEDAYTLQLQNPTWDKAKLISMLSSITSEL